MTTSRQDEPQHEPMPAPDDFSRNPEKAILDYLEDAALPYTNTIHTPTFTVADSRQVKTDIPGGHTKNLFLRDKHDNHVLVSAWSETKLPLNHLHKSLNLRRLSFAPTENLWQLLAVTPGSVSAFALLNDTSNKVRFVLDRALTKFETLNFHPLRNDMTTSITIATLTQITNSTGHDIHTVDFTQLAADTSAP